MYCIIMKLVVGLGNPGKKYEKTRHNVGFALLDSLHDSLKTYGINKWELSKKFNAEISGCTINTTKVILVKPMTFMNGSGQAVGLIAHYYNIPARDIIVVHDDKDIPLGETKVHVGRGHAGHNGIKSILEHIGKDDLTRVRVGIKSDNTKKMQDVSKFVLGKFGIFEKKKLEKIKSEVINVIMEKVLE